MRQHPRNSRRLLLPLLWLGLATIAWGQAPADRSGATTASPRTKAWEQKLQDHIKALASDSMEGRRTGTHGNSLAAAYIRDQFMKYGLQAPRGAGMEGYYNMFAYTAGIQADASNSGSVTRMVNGKSQATPLVMGENFTPLSFSASGNVSGDIVFVGYGITAPEQNYDDYAGINAEGKIVLMMRYSPDGTNPHGDFAAYAGFARKVITAREHGAVGILVVDSPRDADVSGDLLVPLKLDRNFINSGIVAASVHGSLFGALRDSRGRSLGELQRDIDSLRTPASFAATGYSAKLTISVSIVKANVPNVIGILPGTDPKLRDEFIVIGAHFDHLGWGGEGSLGKGDSAIHHGADDNASGSAGLLVLAEYFAQARTNGRSIIFAAFNGEEEGLLGSASMVAHPPFPLDKVMAMVNMDMIGRLDSDVLIVQGIGTSPEWKAAVDSINHARLDLKLVEDGTGPSDHTSFYLKDIPVLFLFTGTHPDYHRPSDTWEKINYPGEAAVVDLVADVLGWLTDHPGRLAFTKTKSNISGSSTGFRVYVGTIPDYAYEGKGLRLSGVSPGGPAEKAGLQEGDILVRMGPKPIGNIYDYTYALGEFRPKEKVELEFLRDGKSQTVMVVLGTR